MQLGFTMLFGLQGPKPPSSALKTQIPLHKLRQGGLRAPELRSLLPNPCVSAVGAGVGHGEAASHGLARRAPHHVEAHVGTSVCHVGCHIVSRTGRQGELQKA